jgi:hypothetical protein
LCFTCTNHRDAGPDRRVLSLAKRRLRWTMRSQLNADLRHESEVTLASVCFRIKFPKRPRGRSNPGHPRRRRSQ